MPSCGWRWMSQTLKNYDCKVIIEIICKFINLLIVCGNTFEGTIIFAYHLPLLLLQQASWWPRGGHRTTVRHGATASNGCQATSVYWLHCHASQSHNRDHFLYVPRQCGVTLQCNVVDHWLSTYTKWYLHNRFSSNKRRILISIDHRV